MTKYEHLERKMIFISYKSEEYHVARSIRMLLEKHNYPCWMAPESIAAGGNYMTEIPKAIRSCDLFVLILSNASQNSQWVQKELDRAVKFNKYILPFHVDDCELVDEIDFVISNNQRIEAYHDFEAGCRELLATVRVLHPTVEPGKLALESAPITAPTLSVPETIATTPLTAPKMTVPTLTMPEAIATTPRTAPKMTVPAGGMKPPVMPKSKTPPLKQTPVVTPAVTPAQKKPSQTDVAKPAPSVKPPVHRVSVAEMRATYECNYMQNNEKGFKIGSDGTLTSYKPSRKEEGIVVIPYGVKEIGGSVFAKCKSMHCVVLPPTLERIGTTAFIECTNLDNVIFHEGLTHIDAGAFQGCSMLKRVTLPQSLTHIGAYAFYGCTSTGFTVHAAVESIGAAAFNQCASVTVQAQNAKYTVYAGCLVDKAAHSVISAAADAVLPATANVRMIGDYAFDGNSTITRLQFADHIKKIGIGAFRGCANVTEVHLGKGIDAVESQAFMHCTSLHTLIMEPGITTIAPQAFAHCKSLKSVNIPKSVRSRAKDAFEGCPRIKIVE